MVLTHCGLMKFVGRLWLNSFVQTQVLVLEETYADFWKNLFIASELYMKKNNLPFSFFYASINLFMYMNRTDMTLLKIFLMKYGIIITEKSKPLISAKLHISMLNKDSSVFFWTLLPISSNNNVMTIVSMTIHKQCARIGQYCVIVCHTYISRMDR